VAVDIPETTARASAAVPHGGGIGAGRVGLAALLALCVGVTLTFLALPIVALFAEVPIGDVPDLLGDPVVRRALEVTARTNAIANVLILAFGTPLAYLLATKRFRGRALVVTLVELPLVLPPAVAGIGLLAAFGANGLLGDDLQRAGLFLPFSEWAVVLAVTFVASPFYIRQAITAFEGVDPALTAAARTLGAGPVRTFWRVSLPLAAAGLIAGWVLAFARGVGEFGATIVFAGNVQGETQTLTLAVYEQLDANFDVALAIGILLVVLSAVVLLSYKLIVSWKNSTSPSSAPFVRSSSTSA
jgi:molybdate transport system permease protein